MKTALVVGASSGIGRATALALARDGWRVMASARRSAQLAELTPACEVFPADVSDSAQMDGLVALTCERVGIPELVVYSAGNNVPRRAMSMLSPADWEMLLDVNLSGAYRLTRAVLPLMRSAGSGLLIYIASIAAHVPDMSGPAYQASKAGLAAFAHAVRLEEKANGIRTSVILPGFCRTDMVNKRPVPTPPEILAQALEPEDVAAAVVAVAGMHPRTVVPVLELLPSRL